MRLASATVWTKTAIAPVWCARAALQRQAKRSFGVATDSKRGVLPACRRRRTASLSKSVGARLSTSPVAALVAESVMLRNSGRF